MSNTYILSFSGSVLVTIADDAASAWKQFLADQDYGEFVLQSGKTLYDLTCLLKKGEVANFTLIGELLP